MFLLGCRDDHGGDVGVADHLVVVAGMDVGAGLLRQGARASRIAIRNREKADGRVFRGEPSAQRPDAPGADHRDADIGLLHCDAPLGPAVSSPRARGSVNHHTNFRTSSFRSPQMRA